MNLYTLDNKMKEYDGHYNDSFVYSNFNYIPDESNKNIKSFWKEHLNDVYDKEWFWNNVNFVFGVSPYISDNHAQLLSAIVNYFNKTQENYLPNNIIILKSEDSFIKLIEKQYNIESDNYHFISIILSKEESEILFCSINVEEIVSVLKETIRLFYKTNYVSHPSEHLDKRARDNIKNQNYYDINSEINTNKDSYEDNADKKYNDYGESRYRRPTRYDNKGNEQNRERYKNIRDHRPGLYERIHQSEAVDPHTASLNSLESDINTTGVFYKINYGGKDNSITYEI